jgi:hypothetical protein
MILVALWMSRTFFFLHPVALYIDLSVFSGFNNSTHLNKQLGLKVIIRANQVADTRRFPRADCSK